MPRFTQVARRRIDERYRQGQLRRWEKVRLLGFYRKALTAPPGSVDVSGVVFGPGMPSTFNHA